MEYVVTPMWISEKRREKIGHKQAWVVPLGITLSKPF